MSFEKKKKDQLSHIYLKALTKHQILVHIKMNHNKNGVININTDHNTCNAVQM